MSGSATSTTDDAGWRQRGVLVARRVAAEAKRDHLTLMSAGVAFYALIALIPAIAAVVSTYGLVADPERVGEHLASFLEAAPEAVGELVLEQAQRVAETSDAAAGLGAVASIALALWAASAGCQHLIVAVNAAYDRDEQRGFVARRALAFALTVGGILFMAVAVAVITLVPRLLAGSALTGPVQGLLRVGRWPLLALGLLFALAVLYRVAPTGDGPPWRWVSPGAVVAALLWLVASGGFSIYVSNFGSYNETYGSLGAVIIVMLWLFLSVLAVILGAEINSEVDKLRAEQHERSGAEALRKAASERPRARADAARVSGREATHGVTIRPESAAGASSNGASPGGWGSVAVVAAGRAVASVFGKRR